MCNRFLDIRQTFYVEEFGRYFEAALVLGIRGEVLESTFINELGSIMKMAQLIEDKNQVGKVAHDPSGSKYTMLLATPQNPEASKGAEIFPTRTVMMEEQEIGTTNTSQTRTFRTRKIWQPRVMIGYQEGCTWSGSV